VYRSRAIIRGVWSAKKYQLQFEHFKNYVLLKDSITNLTGAEKKVRSELNFEFERKQSIEKEKQKQQNEIFNVGIGNGLSVLEIITAFESLTGQKLNYDIGDRRPGDVMSIYSNHNKATEKLGWIPEMNVADIMNTAWAWEMKRTGK